MIGIRAVAVVAGLVVTTFTPAPAQDSSCVTYVEKPDRGPHVERGRPLPASSGAEYGVDINSTIEIRIVADCLTRALNSLDAGRTARPDIGPRIDSLSSALQAVPTAIQQVQELFSVYAAFEDQPSLVEQETFASLLRASAGTRRRIFQAIEGAARLRLQATGVPAQDLRSAIAALRNAQLAGADAQGYNWALISSQLETEIAFLRAELESSRAVEGYDIELRAFLLTAEGQYPVPLRGFNEEKSCSATRVEPIQLELSEDEGKLYERFLELQTKVREVRGFGNALILAVTTDLERGKAEMDVLLGRAQAVVAPVEASARRLVRWGQQGALRTWLTDFSDTIAEDAAGPSLLSAGDTLGAIADTVTADLEALRSLASLRSELANADARSGMVAILARASAVKQLARPATLASLQPGTWAARADVMKRFVGRAEALAPALRNRLKGQANNPVSDALAARDAIQAAADSLEHVSRDAIALLGRILGLPPALVASNLPETQGLARRSIAGDLDTEIRLKELCQTRDENDQVSVEMRFFQGGRQVRDRTDRFHLRLFGWRSRVAASLAFSLRSHTDSWQPGAAVSWIFAHGAWPGPGNRGIGDPANLGQIGFGLTTVNLHFDDEESVQLGIGPSLSFLNDRVIIGAGWNLQAGDDQLYGLLSIRLLDVARPVF